jgi:hypothetical protein
MQSYSFVPFDIVEEGAGDFECDQGYTGVPQIRETGVWDQREPLGALSFMDCCTIIILYSLFARLLSAEFRKTLILPIFRQ